MGSIDQQWREAQWYQGLHELSLTLRRERGAYEPPARLGAPTFFQLLKFGSASFRTNHRSVSLTGGHRWPPEAQWLYTKPKF